MTHRDIEHLTRGEQQQLTTALTNLIDWIAETLDDAITRQHSRTTNPKVSGGTTEQPLPFNDRASEIGWNLRNTLNTWIHETATARHYPQPGRLNLIPAARWLRRNIIGLAISDHAQTAADEILDAINQATRHLDRPTRPDYLGTCPHTTPNDGTPCEAGLWALPTDELIVCRACNTAHPRHEITERLEQQFRDQYLTAPDLAPLIADRLHTTITPKVIHNLGRHRARSIETLGRRLYRAGDILDALTQPTPQRQPQNDDNASSA